MKWYFIIVLSVLFSGCSIFYNIPDRASSEYVRPNYIESNFELSGRFSIKNDSNNQYGNFTWYKHNSFQELTLNTPVGQTVARITVDGGRSTLFMANEAYFGENLDNLMLDKLGFSLPINYLHYWVQGVKVPDLLVNDSIDSVYGFTQLGWKVEYLAWYNNSHPKIVRVSKSGTVIKLFLVWRTFI